MILAAGLSPAWQQIVLLEELRTGEVNRAREVHWCASGKVLNVGIALQALATIIPPSPIPPSRRTGSAATRCASSKTLALIGGPTGDAIQHEFANLNLPSRWIRAASPTRVCTTILDRRAGATTELVENQAAVEPAVLDNFRTAFHEEAREAEVAVLTGSFPAGTPPTLYRELIAEFPGRVLLDCQGPPLLAALEARPFLVKPNREELGRTLGHPVDSESALRAAMRELHARGAEWAVVSEGKERLWISSASAQFSIVPPAVEVVNPIGSGDCLAAGIAVALASGYDLPEAAVWGVAAAAENVRHLLPARIEPSEVKTLYAGLRWNAIGD